MNESDSSLFSRMAKYVPSQASDPKENRMTECLAAVLEHSGDDLVFEFAHMLLDPAGANPSRGETTVQASAEHLASLSAAHSASSVTTQYPVPGENRGKGYLDLVLAFDTDSGPFRLGVEIKIDASLTGDQLSAYSMSEEIDALVLLAPSSKLPKLSIPNDLIDVVGKRSWQTVGELISEFTPEAPEHAAWLTDQFADYLDQEGLMPAMPLSLENLSALEHHAEAERSLSALTAEARIHICKSWATVEAGTEQTRNPFTSWKHYATTSDGSGTSNIWGDAFWFEFGTRSEEIKGAGFGPGLHFIAGASARKSVQLPKAVNVERLHGDGFTGPYKDKYCTRLVRISSLRDILVPSGALGSDTTIEEQGRLVGDWVLSAFRALSLD